MRKTLLFFTLLALPLLAACDRATVQRNPEGGVDVTVTLTESEVNTLLTQALARAEANRGELRLQNGAVDLQPGTLVLTGDFEDEDGTAASGSLTLAVSQVDGKLSVQATSASWDGFDATDERLSLMTARITEALNSRLQRDNGQQITLTSLTVTDNDMTVVLNVQRQGS
jgi:hypothetical protein